MRFTRTFRENGGAWYVNFELIFTPDQGDALANTHSVFPALIGIGLIHTGGPPIMPISLVQVSLL